MLASGRAFTREDGILIVKLAMREICADINDVLSAETKSAEASRHLADYGAHTEALAASF